MNLHLVGIEAERAEVLHQDLRVEDAHHHLLPEGDRQRGDAQLDVAAAVGGLDAAVLRPALLGDVQARHHLDPRHDGRVNDFRHGLDVVQDAVDAEADQAA